MSLSPRPVWNCSGFALPLCSWLAAMSLQALTTSASFMPLCWIRNAFASHVGRKSRAKLWSPFSLTSISLPTSMSRPER